MCTCCPLVWIAWFGGCHKLEPALVMLIWTKLKILLLLDDLVVLAILAIGVMNQDVFFMAFTTLETLVDEDCLSGL